MTEPKKPINFFKILPSFQWPGIEVDLRHWDAEEPAAIDVRGCVTDAHRPRGQVTTAMFKYKITHANDAAVLTLNESGRRFFSRALPAILHKRRPEE